MDSRLPYPGAPAWRTATLVTAAIAAVELALLIVAGLVLLAKPLSHHVQAQAQAAASHSSREAKPVAKAPAPAVRAPERARAPQLSRTQTSVLVLNGNGRTGAAGTEAAQIKQLGYSISSVGDAGRMDYPASVVMFRPGFRGEGERLAHDLSIRTVGSLDGVRIRDLKGAQVAVVVGAGQ